MDADAALRPAVGDQRRAAHAQPAPRPDADGCVAAGPALGLYVVAVTWSNAVSPLPSALANVLFPRTAAQTRPEDRHRVFAKAFASRC
jgi:hypothetical protein